MTAVASALSPALTTVVRDIACLPDDWHGSGTMSERVIKAIVDYSKTAYPLRHTAETSTGKTTLLFSNLSEDHLVFTLDIGGSYTRVSQSALLCRPRVRFVIGPTQATLPKHTFSNELDVVLIDGPHAYPFPDLEYFYFYPHLKKNGVLIIDDVNIPSIHRMFDVIRSDDMFDLLGVVENTAFFRRTLSATKDPFGDGWSTQGYNRSHYEYALARQHSSRTVKILGKVAPTSLKRLVPNTLKLALLRRL